MTDITGTDELNSLGYVSSAPDFTGLEAKTEVKAQDEADLPALVMLFRILEKRKDYYRSNDSISLDQNDGNIREQMKDNKRMVFHIQELEALLTATIQRVKEKIGE